MMYLDLIVNLSLLVALTIVSGFIEDRWPRRSRFGQLLQGALFGGVAVVGMLRPLNLGPGLIFDGRSIMVSLCALFFGPWAATVSGALTIACRIWLGGAGTLTGSLVILVSIGIGMLAHFRLKPSARPPSTASLYMFGIAVHIAMLALMFTLPEGAGITVVKSIGLPVLLLYPLATILAGRILSDQVEAERVIDALRQAKDQAEKANRYKTEFLMNISHDLRTPLNAILGFAHILKSVNMADEYRKGVDFIDERAKHLLALVEDILDASRMESGKTELASEAFDLQKLVAGSIEGARIGLEQKSVMVSLSVHGTIPQLKGAARRVQQIIDNLLNNAVKYTERGEINVTLELDPEQPNNDKHRIRVSVKDTGIGIPTEQLPHIFDPFTRCHEFDKGTTDHGMGLGLHIVQKLVHLMGGCISVSSEAGKGSEFIFTLDFDKVA